MTFNPTRRALATGLLAAIPMALRISPADAAPDPIHTLIKAHREALRVERRAEAAANEARHQNRADFTELRQERRRLRAERQRAHRALKAATPETVESYHALSAHYQGIAPNPDPDDMASRYRADLAAARDRMELANLICNRRSVRSGNQKGSS